MLPICSYRCRFPQDAEGTAKRHGYPSFSGSLLSTYGAPGNPGGAWGYVIPRDFPCHLEIGSLLALLPGYQKMFPFDFKRGSRNGDFGGRFWSSRRGPQGSWLRESAERRQLPGAGETRGVRSREAARTSVSHALTLIWAASSPW